MPRSVAARWRLLRSSLLLGMVSVLLPAVLADAPKTALEPAVTAAQDKQILDEAKGHSQILANLTYLSDTIGPRLTGSANLKRANDWTAAKMREYGLSNVHLEGWTIPMGWERGRATMRILEPNNGRSLTVASMGWSPSTKGKIEGDVVIVKAKNAAELAPYKGKLKNAVVLRGEPATIRPLSERGMNFDQPRRNRDEKGNDKGAAKDAKGDAKAAKGGAKGEVPPPQRPDRNFTQMMSFRREMMDFLRAEGVAAMLMDAGKPHGLLNMTGSWRGNDRVNAGEPLPSLFITHEGYALLHRLASRPAPARTRVEFEIDNKFIDGPVAVYNTVGEIPGSEKPDEFVVVGAHLDSWDLGQGTTDNGTGSCVVLETARILSKLAVKPKRTIRFVLFTGEEQGLHGSKEYVKKHKDEMAKTSMALVHDTGTGRVVGIGLQGRAAIQPIMERELVSLKALGVTGIDLRGMGGTDHLSFEQVGVPGFACRQDPAEYRFTHHSQSDTLDKALEPDLIQGAQVMAVAALHVANLPQMLPRDKPPQDNARGRNRGERSAAPEKEKKSEAKPPVEKK
jgi:carboxypeptidase Q